MIRKVVGLHFSPRGGTAKITEQIVKEVANRLNQEMVEEVKGSCFDMLNYGLVPPKFDEETIAIIGMPVNVGKIPLPAIKMLNSIEGSGAMTIVMVSYGGRTYGNALYELYNCVEKQNFVIVGAGAFIARHGRKEGALPRPDVQDLAAIREFSKHTSNKLLRLSGSSVEGLKIKPAPLSLAGRMPNHRISKISPKAAAMAEITLERANLKRREPEWFL